MSESVKDREKQFHDRRFEQDVDPRAGLDKFYGITAESTALYRARIAANISTGQRLLEYGCGTGGDLQLYKQLGCELHGIDISSEAVIKAHQQAAAANIQANYLVGDAEHTNFADSYFQEVVGSGILHHLDLHRALAELARITAPGGACIFSEPMGHNPLINAFRALTPSMRTPDEHPLLTRDFALMQTYFRTVNVTYFHLLTIGAAFFKRTPLYNTAYRIFTKADRWLMATIPALRKHAWICIIELRDPIKG